MNRVSISPTVESYRPLTVSVPNSCSSFSPANKVEYEWRYLYWSAVWVSRQVGMVFIKWSDVFHCWIFCDLDLPLQKIVDEAKSVRKNAYCPYSNFPVGAALLCEDGMTIISGCNVENLSFGLTNCAERSAIFQAVSRGVRNFPSIAICAEMKDQYVGPCGACRQVGAPLTQERPPKITHSIILISY